MRRIPAAARLSALMALTPLALAACHATPPFAPPRPISVSVTPASVTVTSWRDTVRFTARVTCDWPVSAQVKWKSSNPAVASVDSTGLVTALAAGTASIRATSVADDSAYGLALVTANLHSLPPIP